MIGVQVIFMVMCMASKLLRNHANTLGRSNNKWVTLELLTCWVEVLKLFGRYPTSMCYSSIVWMLKSFVDAQELHGHLSDELSSMIFSL